MNRIFPNERSGKYYVIQSIQLSIARKCYLLSIQDISSWLLTRLNEHVKIKTMASAKFIRWSKAFPSPIRQQILSYLQSMVLNLLRRLTDVRLFQAVLFYTPRWLWKHWEGGKIHALMMDLDIGICSEVEKKQKKKLLLDYLWENLRYHNWWCYRYYLCELLSFGNVVGNQRSFFMRREGI